MFFKRKICGPAWLVAGLGNPGKQYAATRHNVGFDALDALAKDFDIPLKRARFSALCGSGTQAGQSVTLLKPQTYMNLSGQSIAKAAQFYKVPAQNVIVLCDDVNLAPGALRIRLCGSDGGHNGLKSIIGFLGQGFVRIRIGVGAKPHPDYDMANWVMARPPDAEKQLIQARHADIVAAVRLILQADANAAMAKYNGLIKG